jgi:hypothetical protein
MKSLHLVKLQEKMKKSWAAWVRYFEKRYYNWHGRYRSKQNYLHLILRIFEIYLWVALV